MMPKLKSAEYGTINTGGHYSDDELEFLAAMQRYMSENRRRFPTFTEVLAVAKSLGYRKVEIANTNQRSENARDRL